MTTIPKNNSNGDGSKYKPVDNSALPTEEPQIETVLNIPALIPQDHIWIQQGRHIIDYCEQCPQVAIEIPSGQTLIKDKDGYRMVPDQEAVKLNTR